MFDCGGPDRTMEKTSVTPLKSDERKSQPV